MSFPARLCIVQNIRKIVSAEVEANQLFWNYSHPTIDQSHLLTETELLQICQYPNFTWN